MKNTDWITAIILWACAAWSVGYLCGSMKVPQVKPLTPFTIEATMPAQVAEPNSQ